MKKLILFSIICISVLCLSANVKIANTLMVILDPVLPENHFDYSLNIPQHILDGEDNPYGPIDTVDLIQVNDAKATLGRVLFYDEIISADQNIACATCHLQSLSFADEFDVSQGVNGDTKRNSLQLNDLGWANNDGFFWDMRKTDLAEIIEVPLTDGNEIGVVDFDEIEMRMLQTNYYPDLFEDAYGSVNTMNKENIIDAMVHFISSINSFDSKLDKVLRGEESFTAQEQNGFMEFQQICAQCHFAGGGEIFGPDPLFQMLPFFFSNGTAPGDDLGIGEFYPGLDHLFKVPTLRNIALTGPYMHDGRLESLEDVLKHYSEDAVDDGWGFVPPGGFGFSDQQQNDIIAFLNTMTDETMLVNEKWSDPFENSLNVDPEDIESLNIKVYPNPASYVAQVEFDNPQKQMIRGTLFSSIGQLIQRKSTHGNQISYNVSNLSPGMYMIQLDVNGNKTTKELVIEK